MANDANIGTVSNNILLGASTNYSNFFVNHTIYNLHLTASASAVDAGTNTNAPTIDIEGGLRPQGNSTDVGAYEYENCNSSFSITPPTQTTICEGESITLTTNANSTANWNNNVIDNVLFTPTITQTYIASVGIGNCLTTHQININVTPTPSFTPIADRISVCLGDSITLTTNANSTATWNYGVIDNIAFVPPSPQTYTATVTNGNCTHSEQIAINVSAIPFLTISASDSSVCQGNSITLNATTDGMNMSWDNNIQNNIPFTPATTQTYTATANNYGCTISESIVITVLPTPVIIITQNGAQLTTNNTNGTLQWFLNGNQINNAITDTLEISSNGVYSITIIDNNGCVGSSNTIAIQEVAVQENNIINFTIYPNPIQDNFTIFTNLKVNNIQIYSAEGNLVKETLDKTINVSKLTAGIYRANSYFQTQDSH